MSQETNTSSDVPGDTIKETKLHADDSTAIFDEVGSDQEAHCKKQIEEVDSAAVVSEIENDEDTEETQHFIELSDEELADLVEADSSEEQGEALLKQEAVLSKKTHKILMVLVLLILALGGAAILYRGLPSTRKLAGDWAQTEGNYGLQIKDDQASIEVLHYGGSEQIQLSLQGDLVPENSNRYNLTNIQAFLTIQTDGFSEEDLAAVKEAEALYEVINETTTELRLKYTEAAMEELGTQIDLSKFSFSLENFKWGLFSQQIRMRNETFDLNGILFTKQ